MFKDKSILVIGGTGSIGQAIVEKLIPHSPKVIRILSRDEYKQFILQKEYDQQKNIRFLIGDIRDKERLDRAMHEIDIVFDLAALKHVPACEYDPFEAVKTNIIGTQNVIECAMKNNVEKVIYTSSDKAVSPTNTMGATKLLAERIISSTNYSKGDSKTIFASVRFGNVIGSRGSVIPLFKQQILTNRCITITEPEMSRFMMSKSQAVDLIFKAYKSAKGGEVFVLKMPVIILRDLAEVVIEMVSEKEKIDINSVDIRRIGLRPGEKMYEELMSEAEAANSIELDDMYVINSFFQGGSIYEIQDNRKNEYNSNYKKPLNKTEIRELLLEEGLI